jgi:hypothetical protein
MCVATPGGLPGTNQIKVLRWKTTRNALFDHHKQSGALENGGAP